MRVLKRELKMRPEETIFCRMSRHSKGSKGPEKARDTTWRGNKQAACGKAGPHPLPGPSAGGAHKVQGTRHQEPPEPPRVP